MLNSHILEKNYREHSKNLKGFLIKTFRIPPETADDVVNESFLKIWKNRSAYDSSREFRPYLYTVAINTIKSKWNKDKKICFVEEFTEKQSTLDNSPEKAVQIKEEVAILKKNFNYLSTEQRQVIFLVRLREMKIREAASIMEIPENTAKTYLRRGLLKLQELMKNTCRSNL